VVPPVSTPEDPYSLQAKAEEVRAYLVAIRGGAPFLSAADGRLLVRWLEQGISVARILAAVDETAEKRRKKRTRSRLSLTACRRSIEKKTKIVQTQASSTETKSRSIQMLRYAEELSQMSVPNNLGSAQTTLVMQIRSLDGSTDPESAATEAVSACRYFHEAAWKACSEEHASLREEAMMELAALKNILNPDALAAAVDEVARDIVRRRTPLVSAKVVWDRVSAE
jgi:hypothetical protein